jgi:hypothetical protein
MCFSLYIFSNYIKYFQNILKTLSWMFLIEQLVTLVQLVTFKHEKLNIGYNGCGSC